VDNLAEQKRYTYADYMIWKGDIRYEIIDGTAYAMAAPSRLHQKVRVELLRQFANFLRGKLCSEIRDKVIRALKASGANITDEQIEKSIKILDREESSGRS
jgi:Uma2 family endonuclease